MKYRAICFFQGKKRSKTYKYLENLIRFIIKEQRERKIECASIYFGNREIAEFIFNEYGKLVTIADVNSVDLRRLKYFYCEQACDDDFIGEMRNECR